MRLRPSRTPPCLTVRGRDSIIRCVGDWRAEAPRFVGFRGPGRPVFGFPSHLLVGAGSGLRASGCAAFLVGLWVETGPSFISSGLIADDLLLTAPSAAVVSRRRSAADARNPVGVRALLVRPLGHPGVVSHSTRLPLGVLVPRRGRGSRFGWEARPTLRRCTEGKEFSCRNADDPADVPVDTVAREGPVALVVVPGKASKAVTAAGVAVAFAGVVAAGPRPLEPERSAWIARACGRRSRSPR